MPTVCTDLSGVLWLQEHTGEQDPPMREAGKGSNEDSFSGGLAVSGTFSSEVLISLPTESDALSYAGFLHNRAPPQSFLG